MRDKLKHTSMFQYNGAYYNHCRHLVRLNIKLRLCFERRTAFGCRDSTRIEAIQIYITNAIKTTLNEMLKIL